MADGAILVSRREVYGSQPPPGTHYIALAVKPSTGLPGDTGDFHYWRLDGDIWSYKVGACFFFTR